MTRLSFDTTVINHLEDDGEASEPLMRGLELGYDVILPAMVVDEILATKRRERRDALLNRFSRFLSKSRCIWPPNEILRLHVRAYRQNPRAYAWNRVNVWTREYEQAVVRRDLPDHLFDEQRRMQSALQDQWKQSWISMYPTLGDIMTRDPTQRLNSFEEAAEASTKLPGGLLWGIGIELFKRGTLDPDLTQQEIQAAKAAFPPMTDQEIEPFIEGCPPFRASCYCFVKAWFNHALSPPDADPKSGRNDLMMSAYLPYCDKFLTGDYAQQRDLQDISHAAGLQCQVMSLQEFSDSFKLLVKSSAAADENGCGSPQ